MGMGFLQTLNGFGNEFLWVSSGGAMHFLSEFSGVLIDCKSVSNVVRWISSGSSIDILNYFS